LDLETDYCIDAMAKWLSVLDINHSCHSFQFSGFCNFLPHSFMLMVFFFFVICFVLSKDHSAPYILHCEYYVS
jgi:hypothetical protein